MDGYICLKPLTLSGVEYLPGNHIPADAVLSSRVRALMTQGYIASQDTAAVSAEADAKTAPEPVFMIPVSPVSTDGEHLDGIPATEGSVAAMALTLMLTAEDATRAIRDMDDETALRLIQALDSRKSVKSAAAAKLEELRGGEV